MFYREAGQFKTSYSADQAVFPIAQDRIFIAIWLFIGFVAVPLLSSEYLFRAILIPFLILALAALGLNLLVGYCGQVSLGTGAFMAVGAYAAYNFWIRIPGLNPLIAFLLAGGAAGKRYCLPNARTMIHQPSGGAQGQATDIDIHAKEILIIRERLNQLMAGHTGQDLETIQRDTERDNFMNAEQSMAYGLVDEVISKREV